MTWARGRDEVQRLIDDGGVEIVEASTDVADRRLRDAEAHVRLASLGLDDDPAGALQLSSATTPAKHPPRSSPSKDSARPRAAGTTRSGPSSTTAADYRCSDRSTGSAADRPAPLALPRPPSRLPSSPGRRAP